MLYPDIASNRLLNLVAAKRLLNRQQTKHINKGRNSKEGLFNNYNHKN